MPVDEVDNSAEEPPPHHTDEEDIENIPCDAVPGAEPSEVSVQHVFALVNKVLRKGTKGKELDPNKFNDQERKAFDDADMDQWNTHIRTCALAVILPKKAEDIDRRAFLGCRPGSCGRPRTARTRTWQSSKRSHAWWCLDTLLRKEKSSRTLLPLHSRAST